MLGEVYGALLKSIAFPGCVIVCLTFSLFPPSTFLTDLPHLAARARRLLLPCRVSLSMFERRSQLTRGASQGQPTSTSHELAHRQPTAAQASVFYPLSRRQSGQRW